MTRLKKDGIPTLQLDAGDMFVAGYQVLPNEEAMVDARNALFLEVYATLGVSAYNVGDRDLALGRARLEKLAQKAHFKFLSANLVDATTKKPIFAPSTVVTLAGRRIAVIGVLTQMVYKRKEHLEDQKLELLKAEDAVASEIARLKASRPDLVVVLGHLTDGEIDAVTKRNPEVALVLGGQSMTYASGLKRSGKAFVAQAFMRGKNISVLSAHVQNGKLTFVDRFARQALEREKAQLVAQVTSRERSLEVARKDPKRAGGLDYLEKSLVRLKTQVQQLTMDLEDVPQPDPKASYLSWELAAIGQDLPDDPDVLKRVEAFRKVHPDPTAKPHPRPAAPPPLRGGRPPTPGIPPRIVPMGPRVMRPGAVPAPPRRVVPAPPRRTAPAPPGNH